MKSTLRSFELSHVENLDVNLLLAELRPCVALESIRLIDVELIGEFPNAPEQKLNLPNLHDFNLKLTYPPQPIPSSLLSYIFFTNGDYGYERDVNIRLEVGGYVNFVLDHNFDEFLVGYNESSLVSKFLMDDSTLISPTLRQLTLKGTDVVSEDLIPSDLSYLQLMYNQIGSSDDNMELTYNEIIHKSKRLRSLHLVANEWEMPLLDLNTFPSSLEYLSLTNFRLNYTRKPAFNHLRDFYLHNCVVEAPGLFEKVDSVIPHPEKFGVTFPDASGSQCYTLLQGLIFSKYYPLYDNLAFVYIENCERNMEDIAGFEKVEGFLASAGIPKDASDFVLEKRDAWTGRGVDNVEKKRIIYDFERWDKLEAWNTFKNL